MLLINAGNLVVLLQDIKPVLSLQIYYWIKLHVLIVVGEEVTRDLLFSFLTVISITYLLMS